MLAGKLSSNLIALPSARLHSQKLHYFQSSQWLSKDASLLLELPFSFYTIPLSSRRKKMSAEPVPLPLTPNTNFGSSYTSSDSSSLPLWDKVTTWVAQNKPVVYTIAGVTVVVSLGGVAYYLSGSRRSDIVAQDKKRLSKKERRKAKQEKERGTDQASGRSAPEVSQPTARAATVESDPLDGIPQIDESNIESLSDEVKDFFHS